jgi:hypothetical protein
MPNPVDVEHIVRDYLIEHNYDGLAGEECGCGLDNLMCCLPDNDISGCVPAHKRKATQSDIDNDHDVEIGDDIFVPDQEQPDAQT